MLRKLFFLLLTILLPLPKVHAYLKIHFIDVGYGDCCLLEMFSGNNEKTNILVDCGKEEYSKHIIKYLKKRKIKHIDHIFITHPHDDHYGSLLKILKKFNTGQIHWNGDDRALGIMEKKFLSLVEKLKNKGTPLQTIRRGKTIIINDDFNIEILHPKKISGSTNDASMVIRFNYGKISFIMFSDIGPAAQADICGTFSHENSWKLNAQIATWPHHGDIFTDKLQESLDSPKFIVVQTGINPYNIKPNPNKLKLKTRVLQTDKDGAIVIESNGKDIHYEK